MSISKIVFSLILLPAIVVGQSNFSFDKKNSSELDLLVSDNGIFYKGQELTFDKSIDEWEKVLGKARIDNKCVIDTNWIACYYTWDELGLVAYTIPNDDSQMDSRILIRELYVYYRNLDSKIGRIGRLTRHHSERYYNIQPKDWLETKEWLKGKNELSKEDLESITYLNSRSSKKSEFIYPFKIHKKPISIQGATIDSTMNIQAINNNRALKGLSLFYFYPVMSSLKSYGDDEDTSGLYEGRYRTYFGEEIKYELEAENLDGEVIYIRIRKFSPKEMKEFK